MTVETLAEVGATFEDSERAFRSGKALTGDQWAALGPDFWPSGHEWHNYNPRGNVPRNRMGSGATSQEWPKVEAAIRRCDKRLKPIQADATLTEADRGAAVAHAVAEWQADERQREAKASKPARKPKRKVNVHRVPRKPGAPLTKIERERADDAAFTARQSVSEVPDYLRMYRADLEALGTPDAIAELVRRRAKREAKRAERREEVSA